MHYYLLLLLLLLFLICWLFLDAINLHLLPHNHDHCKEHHKIRRRPGCMALPNDVFFGFLIFFSGATPSLKISGVQGPVNPWRRPEAGPWSLETNFVKNMVVCIAKVAFGGYSS